MGVQSGLELSLGMGAEGDVDWLDLMSDEIRFRSLAGGAVKMELTRKDEVKRYFQSSPPMAHEA